MPEVPTEFSQSFAANAIRVEGRRRTRRFCLSLVLFLVDGLAAYAIALYAGAAASSESPPDQTDHRAPGDHG